MKKNMLSALILSTVMTASATCVSCTEKVEIPQAPVVVELPDWEDDVDGSIYDYTATMKPERPYMHSYHKAMMCKLFMARPDGNGGSNVGLTFAEALDVIKGVDNMTSGIPKIVYLVGWQYEGHDWKYPAFFEFNEALKRPEDTTARDSYRWLREEAKKYNTTVSVHVLLGDAFPNSPLWHEYVKHDFICRDAAGNFTPLAVFNGVQVYNVNNVNEWKKGYLQQRLEKLIEIADLKDAKTVHFDAFFGRVSPYHETTVEEMEVVLRKVIRWLRDSEIDVTAEFWHNVERLDPMFGLQACSWWDDRSAYEHAQLPPSLCAGGRVGRFGKEWQEEIFLFGDSYGLEDDFNFVDIDPSKNWKNAWNKARLGIATHMVPMMYFNLHEVLDYDADKKTVTYTDGLVANFANQTVKQDDMLLRDHDNIFIPLIWNTDVDEILVYSKNGYGNKRWKLPQAWRDLSQVKVYSLTEQGRVGASDISVSNGEVSLEMEANSMLILQK